MQKLKIRNHTDSEINEALDKLAKQNLQSDERCVK
jgi:SOS response regulatory protein OraA/RecX